MDDIAPAPEARGRPATRPMAVAGSFYPRDAEALVHALEDAFGQARQVSLPPPKALVVPHAGYVYSGPIAASAYATLGPRAAAIRRVVLLGPCHRVAVRGLALPTVEAFESPFGAVPIDAGGVAAIATLPQVVRSDAAHAGEHSLEVQLPFLQQRLRDFTLLPLAVGSATPAEVAEVLERTWGGDETLVVISSDLSHYLRYDEARTRDVETARAIVALDPAIDHDGACGATPLTGLLRVAKRRGMTATLVDLRNSGDTAGDQRRVVGYGAFAFHEGDDLAGYDASHGRELLGIARHAIRAALGGEAAPQPRAAWLDARRATFVTLRQDLALRGCVGSIDARRALREDVASNARAAALRDPRFAPMTAPELARTTIEVSLLSTPVRLDVVDRDDLCARLVPGRDGLVLGAGTRRATFLPQVWSSVDGPAQFVDELLRKAGLPRDHPVETCTIERYRVRKWSETEGAP